MKNLKLSKHKQYKHFTIMLIPDNNKRIAHIKIPYWIGHVLAILILMVLAVIIFFVVRTSMLDKLQIELEQQQYENVALEQQKTQAQQQEKTHREKYQELLDDYSKKSLEFEQKTNELEEKILEIEVIRESLYEQINEASKKLGLEETTPEAALDVPVGVGGAPDDFASHMDTVELLYARMETLNTTIHSEIDRYNVLINELNKVQEIITTYPSIWPVHGRITQEMEYRVNPFTFKGYEYHSGMDIAVPTGTPVHATADGTVSISEYHGGYGYLVVLSHGNGLETYYGHNSELLVSAGDSVKMGDVIAKAGSTGRSTGPHVHYEIRLNGDTQNPRNYLPKEE